MWVWLFSTPPKLPWQRVRKVQFLSQTVEYRQKSLKLPQITTLRQWGHPQSHGLQIPKSAAASTSTTIFKGERRSSSLTTIAVNACLQKKQSVCRTVLVCHSLSSVHMPFQWQRNYWNWILMIFFAALIIRHVIWGHSVPRQIFPNSVARHGVLFVESELWGISKVCQSVHQDIS